MKIYRLVNICFSLSFGLRFASAIRHCGITESFNPEQGESARLDSGRLGTSSAVLERD